MKKRRNCSSFPQYFQYISNFKSPVTHIFVKRGCSNYFSPILQLWYVEVRISRSISESPLEFETIRVDYMSSWGNTDIFIVRVVNTGVCIHIKKKKHDFFFVFGLMFFVVVFFIIIIIILFCFFFGLFVCCSFFFFFLVFFCFFLLFFFVFNKNDYLRPCHAPSCLNQDVQGSVEDKGTCWLVGLELNGPVITKISCIILIP